MKILLLIYIIINFSNFAIPQNSDEFYGKFIQDLVNNSPELEKYLAREEIINSNRLGISYENVKWKFLISRDLDNEIRDEVFINPPNYKLQINKINENTTELKFILDNSTYNQKYYFENGKLISPLTFYAKSWKKLTSKYFKFFISDPVYFNDYCMSKLDSYVDNALDLLNVSNDERFLLEKEKIIYLLCRDENEIKMITGFVTRGMFILADDAIVSTYNYHAHEISHLLINFKLKTLPLFTLPFVQEGFAVAIGGRGGLSSNVLMDVGHYLLENDIIKLNSILTRNSFLSEDPSVTYPVAGLLNNFMINSMSIEQYLNVYRSLSLDSKSIGELDSQEIISSLNFDFSSYLANYRREGKIDFGITAKLSDPFYSYEGNEVIEVDDYYLFKIKTPLLISTNTPLFNYQSKKFMELLPSNKYKGEKYFLNVTDSEIKLYNLYCNELIASYDAGFSGKKTEIKKDSGYEFFIPKNLFDEKLSELLIIKTDTH